jgi:hypothetical protein
MTRIYRNNTMNMRRQIGDALPTYVYKTADQTAIGAAYADVTGMGFAVAANTAYAFEYHLIMDADATTTGIYAAVNGPAAPTSINYTLTYWLSSLAPSGQFAVAYDTAGAHVTSQGAAQAIYVVSGILRNGANAGTLIARAGREAVGSGPNVRAGSYGWIRKLT